MVNESTPEERLKRYKEQLAKMAESEDRDLKFSNPVKVKETPPEDVSETPKAVDSSLPIRNPSPPRTLVSPAKRELRESMVVSNKAKRDALLSKLSDKDSKNKIMMKARIKAIESKLQDIRSRKSTIELQYKRKMINKSEYEKRMEILVREGKELLREKAEIDKSLSK